MFVISSSIPLLIWLSTLVWMAIDARTHRIAVDKKPYGLNNGALAWLLTGILLWIFTFPYYLWKRSGALGARQPERGASAPPIASPHGDGRQD